MRLCPPFKALFGTSVMYGFAGLFFFLLSSGLFAQSVPQKQRIDSLHSKLSKDSAHIYRFKKVRPFLGIDQRNSWIRNVHGVSNVPVNINGLQLGVILKDKHTLGLGFYSITNSSKQPQKLTDRDQKVKYQNLKLGYAMVFYQYVIVDRRFFELDLPLEIGVGNYDYYLSDSVKTVLPKTEEKGPMRITGGGVNIVLKPVKWIGISGMAGYRFAGLNKSSNLNLNGFYYSYGVWLDLRQIVMDTKFYLVKKRKYKKEVKRILATPAL
ncbi:MAG: hypothetical protein ACXVP0_13435 [Bacteroidia bacterium]